MKTIITLPIESRAETHRFYVDAFGLATVGEPADDESSSRFSSSSVPE